MNAKKSFDSENELYRLLADNMADMIVILDRQGRIKYTSPSTERITGYSMAELTEGTIARFLTPASARLTMALLTRLRRHDRQGDPFSMPIRVEVEMILKDGRKIDVEVMTNSMIDDRGAGNDLLCVIRDITERKHAQASEREQRALADALRETASALTSTLDLDEVLDRIIEFAGRVVKFDGMVIRLIEGNVVRIVRHRYEHHPVESFPDQEIVLGDSPMLTITHTTQTPEYIPDTHNDPRWLIFPGFEWIRSYVTLPIIERGNVIGFMEVVDAQPDAFTPREIERLAIFAMQATVAIHNANMYKGASRQASEMTTLNRISAALISGLEMSVVLKTLYEECRAFLRMDSFYVALLNRAKNLIEFPFFVDSGQILSMSPQKIDERKGLTTEVIRTGQTLYLPDATQMQARKRHSIVRAGGTPTRSYIGAPMRLKGEIIGVLSVQSTEPDCYSETDLRLIETIANHAAIAIQNARLFTETIQHADHMTSLYRFALTITEGLEMTKVLQTLYAQCQSIAVADIFYIGLYDQETGLISFPLFIEAGQIADVTARALNTTGGMTRYIIERRESLYVGDMLDPHQSAGLPVMRVGGMPARSYLGIPLIVRDQVIGLISVQSYQPGAYTDEHLQLFETIAMLAALAIDNAGLFSETRRLSIVDPLTGVCNRRRFFEIAEQELDRARRYKHPLSLITLDADDFKKVNDNYGHLTGDRVLIELVRVCEKILRSSDTLGRFGGEEFLILLPETCWEDAMKTAERIRAAIALIRLPESSDRLSISASLGVAAFIDSDRSVDDLIKRADDALYRAKNAGKNQVAG
jgi:diguanylate cyclase (GGDEF)-like protein/PAS domain S-box-containing protein